MFKVVILLASVAAAAAGFSPVTTPLIGRLIPQPSLAPANTEHAGYVSGLTPVVGRQLFSYHPANSEHAGYVSGGLTPVVGRQIIAYQPSVATTFDKQQQNFLYSGYSAEHIPLAYASNYVAYSGPAEASSYRISY